MVCFWICCIFLLSLSTSGSVPYPSNRCYQNDCSFQFQDFKKDMCKIYNTSVCLDFYKFEESSDETLESEDESKFFVSVIPYIAELFVYPKSVKLSAINITFTINNTVINGLIVKISTKVFSRQICRIFDFQNVNSSEHLPINLFYDCLFNLVEHKMINVRMDFIALPIKEKLSYFVSIPATEYPGPCTWRPLIMVFIGSLQNGVVLMKFSQASEFYNVSSYEIKLTENISGDEKSINVTPNIQKSMLFAQFSSVDEGVYSVSVKPIIWGFHEICWAETDIFVIEKPKADHKLTIYLCILILLIFSTLVLLILFRRNIAKLRFGSKRQIILLYSHDCNEHKDFVIAFIKYLTKHCHMKVSSIYNEPHIDCIPDEKLVNDDPNVNECNPQEWFKKKYSECDIIMYLISAGLFHTLDKKHFLPIQKYHEWRKQLLWATKFIESNNAEDIGNKKICQVCFPYSSKKFIPDRLRLGFGECYALPQEMNKLMNFIHDSGECFLCNKLCLTNFESSFEDTDLFKKMRDVQAAVDSNTHIRIMTPLNDTTENDLNFADVQDENFNDEEISTISVSSEENSDSVINFLSKHKPMLKGSCVNISSSVSSDNICPMIESEDIIKLNIHESESDSSSEDSDLLFYPPILHSERDVKLVIENIFNKN